MRRVVVVLAAAPVAAACEGELPPLLTQEREAALAVRDLPEIIEHDTLVVLSPFNSTSYFVYRGEAMGFEYELLREFARSLGVGLRVSVVYDTDSILRMIEEGRGDVAGGRLVPPGVPGRRIAFATPLYETRPTVVQRSDSGPTHELPEAVDSAIAEASPAAKSGVREEVGRGEVTAMPAPVSEATLRARRIRAPADLVGEEVHLPWHSPFKGMLLEIADAHTGDILIVEADPDASDESLITSVANGEIDLTVSPHNLARLREASFDNLSVLPTVGPELPVAWAVRENAVALLAALDEWLAKPETQQLRDRLYTKYFIDRRAYRERVASEYLASETGRLSTYDELFQRYAAELGWDWRLLASQAYQESRFRPTARSWAGAQGLLQLMPATARSVGVRNANDPEQNVRGSVRFTRELERFWSTRIADPQERLKFVLASYNVGIGHVADAQRLVQKHGGDPLRWDDVAFWLLQKSQKEVYTDPVVRYGFARGLEPVTYVALVLERFEHYRQFVTS